MTSQSQGGSGQLNDRTLTESFNCWFAKVVGDNLREIIYDRRDAVECWWTTEFLQMPEEKAEHNPRTNAHKPGDEEKERKSGSGELLQNCQVLSDLRQRSDKRSADTKVRK